MHKLSKIPVVTALSASLLLSLSTGVEAGGGDHHYRDHGYAPPHRYQNHERYHARPYRQNNYRHHGDDRLVIGLLVGGIVGYAINNAQRREVVQYDSYPPATALPPQQSYPVTRYEYADPRETCLQEREYQTTVTVGGRQVPAYGTACLQPDGSWSRGPAQTASY